MLGRGNRLRRPKKEAERSPREDRGASHGPCERGQWSEHVRGGRHSVAGEPRHSEETAPWKVACSRASPTAGVWGDPSDTLDLKTILIGFPLSYRTVRRYPPHVHSRREPESGSFRRVAFEAPHPHGVPNKARWSILTKSGLPIVCALAGPGEGGRCLFVTSYFNRGGPCG